MGQRETLRQSIRAIRHAYHFVDLERGVRRNGKLIASDIQGRLDTIRRIAQQERLSQACLERIAKAERVVPKWTVTAGAPLRALAECLRTPLFEPGGALSTLSPTAQS